MPTTTEIKMTEAGCLRDTYFVPQLSLPPYSNLTNLDWTEVRNKTLARGNATRETKRTTHNNSKSAIPQTKQHNVWEYSDNWQDDSRVVVLKTHTVGWGVEEDTQTHRERDLLKLIAVTAPVSHFDTSWLNTDANRNTAREFQKPERNKSARKTCENWSDETRVMD